MTARRIDVLLPGDRVRTETGAVRVVRGVQGIRRRNRMHGEDISTIEFEDGNVMRVRGDGPVEVVD